MSRKLLVIGLDGVEAPLLDELIAEGALAALAGLAERGVSTPLQATGMQTLPGAIWQDIFTGRSVAEHGDYFIERLHTGEAEPRGIDPTQHGGTYVWDEAARRGLRSIVVDGPMTTVYPGISDLVTLVCEWHAHDVNYGRCSHPPELIAKLEERYGVRPHEQCDFLLDGTDQKHREFIDKLRIETGIKAEMAAGLMADQPWDLAMVSMSQGHCVGHQMWGFHDDLRSGRDHRGFGTAVIDVYRAIDDAIGRLVDAAGDDADVVVFTSHGMENFIGGPQLIPDVLRAMEFGDPRKGPSRLRQLVPANVIHRVFDRFPKLLELTDRLGAFHPVLGENVEVMAVRNNRVGALRVNMIGREPNGVVDPNDADAIIDRIITELEALRHPVSGEPIVTACHRPADYYGPDHHPDLPDLMVAFRQDLGLLDAAVSERLGPISSPPWITRVHRTGDHSSASHLWASVADVDRSRLTGLDSLDLAPLILELLERSRPEPVLAAGSESSS
jgi:predicted AlkP superfamily phosphohydrolase/phosphomutase